MKKGKIISAAALMMLILGLTAQPGYAAEHSLYLDIHFVGNWIFDTYDVEVYLDDELIDTIPHGEDFTRLIENVEDGKHTVMFCSEDSDDAKGEESVEIKGDTTFKCTIYAHNDEINIEDVETEGNVDKAFIPVPEMNGLVLSIAEKELKTAGFVNVSSEAESGSVWDSGNWVVTGQNIEAGNTADKGEKIVLTCKKTEEYLGEFINGLSIPEAAAKAEELGFSVSFVSNVSGGSLDSHISDMDDDEKENWKVDSIDPASGKPEAELGMLYHGEKTVPDVVGKSLYEAQQILKDAEFSSVDYESNDGDSIWLSSNWEVLYQNVAPGSDYNAMDNIHLIVQSYDSIKKDGRAVIDKPVINADEVVPEPKTDEATEVQTETATEKMAETLTEEPEEALSEATTESKEAAEQITENNSVESETVTEVEKTGAKETETEEKITEAPETEQSTEPDYDIDFDSKETVMAVQDALNKAGFDCGAVDGIAGKNTKGKIVEFKRENDLGEKEEIDLELIKALGIDPASLEKPETEIPKTEPSSSTTSSTTSKTDSVYYSTNNNNTAKNGNTGVYAYKSRGGSYDQYYVIDFNNGRAYAFFDGNGSSEGYQYKIESGSFNDVVILLFDDGYDSWKEGLHFKYVNQPDHLIMQDTNGFEYDFYPTDLDAALKIKGTKSMMGS